MSSKLFWRKTTPSKNVPSGSTTRGAIYWHFLHPDRNDTEPKKPNVFGDKTVQKVSHRNILEPESRTKYRYGVMFARDPFLRAVSAYIKNVKEIPRLLQSKNFRSISDYFRYLVDNNEQNFHFKSFLSFTLALSKTQPV